MILRQHKYGGGTRTRKKKNAKIRQPEKHRYRNKKLHAADINAFRPHVSRDPCMGYVRMSNTSLTTHVITRKRSECGFFTMPTFLRWMAEAPNLSLNEHAIKKITQGPFHLTVFCAWSVVLPCPFTTHLHTLSRVYCCSFSLKPGAHGISFLSALSPPSPPPPHTWRSTRTK